MSADPALQFWRHYAEREGALTEGDLERMVMLLPRSLCQRFGLSETVTATSDPTLAREEGALLMVPGNPVLDAAAEQVLEEGDGGHLWLEWPARPLPTAAQLMAAARDRLGIDHGRIDPGGVPVPRYAPVLRVGVQVTYALHDRFQEQEEVFVDPVAGQPLPEEQGRQLATLPQLTGAPSHPALEVDLMFGIGAAHREVEERTGRRLQVLAGQVAHIRKDEQALAESYYTTALESIEERRQTATPDRQRQLDAQAETTRAEWSRRKQEIAQKFEPQRQLRPVRLHLIWVPAMSVPVVIRRGGQGFPFELTWWLPAERFAPVRCPSCGRGAQLVAARDRLACRACLPPRHAAAAVQPPAGLPGRRHPPETGQRDAAPPGQVAVERTRPPAARARTIPAEGASPAETFRALEGILREARTQEERRQRITRTGDNLGFTFWQAVFLGESWPRKRANPDSPLRVLYRLYGPEAPLRAIGIPPWAVPLQSSSSTHDPEPGILNCTDGLIVTREGQFSFSLHWQLVGGKPAVEEVIPCLGACDAHISMDRAIPRAATALYGGAPSYRGTLDPVAEMLWSTELRVSGLPVVARCLAAWWRLPPDALPDLPAAALAAGLAAVVGRRAGLNRTREKAAADYAANLTEVTSAATAAQSQLGLSGSRWW